MDMWHTLAEYNTRVHPSGSFGMHVSFGLTPKTFNTLKYLKGNLLLEYSEYSIVAQKLRILCINTYSTSTYDMNSRLGTDCTKQPTSAVCTQYWSALPPTKHLKLYESTLCWSTVYCLCIQYLVHLLRCRLWTGQHHALLPKEPSEDNTGSATKMISSTVVNQQSPATSTAWQSEKRKSSHNCSNNKNGRWNCDPSQKWTHRQVLKVIWTQAVRLKEFKSIRIYIN